MRKFRSCLFILIGIAAPVLLFGSAALGQEPGGSKPAARELFTELVRSKRAEGGAFVLLTPRDLAGISTGELRSMLAGGDPCDSAAEIAIGQTINGSLTSGDCRLDDNSYADFYVFDGFAGQQVIIEMSSTAFDTYLALANTTGTFILEDNNGGGGTNSRITTNLPEAGMYVILANAFHPNTFGNYTLSLPGCTYSINPTSATVPGIGGTFTFALTTQPGCYWGAVAQAPDSFITVNNNNGHGSAIITYTVAISTNIPPRTGTIRVGGQVFTVTQNSIDCTYSISPLSADHSPDPVTAEFMMNTSEGCPWIARYNNYWVWTTNDVKRGPGPVTYTVAANNGSDREGSITVAGHTFTVRQAGRNCTYSVTPASLQLLYLPYTEQFTVDTQPGCTWVFSGGYNYTLFPNGRGGTGPSVVNYHIYQNYSFSPRTWTIEFTGLTSTNILFNQNGFPNRRRFDYDGDGLADLSVWRPADNNWHLQRTSAGYTVMTYGAEGDRPVPADYDGDLKTDVAVFRPSEGKWYVFMSQSQTFQSFNWGQEGDLPVPSDRDADQKADLVLYRPSNNTWYTRFANGTFDSFVFGEAGDKPLVGDFDADGRGDIAVYRPSNNNWYVIKSNTGFFVQTWGEPGDQPVTGDFDGDGKTDNAVFRPSTGEWFLSRSTQGFTSQTWGQEGDIPVPADYNGDGKTDVAVFRPSNGTWYIVRSGSGILVLPFGQEGDVPTQSAFNY